MSHPFSKTKLITFRPQFIFKNKHFIPLYVIQSECELKGMFKVHPYEKSVFHWTDSSKLKEICIRYEEYEFSGPIALSQIEAGTEIVLRLKNQIDTSLMIVTLSVREEFSSLVISFSDTSYMPPY